MVDLTGKTVSNYRIVEQIGRGGMATVYKAYQPALERYVAIKVIHEQLVGLDEQFPRRFQREAKAVATLRHPNIVQVFDFGIEDDVMYMVMEYLEGSTLKAALKELSQRGEFMPLDETLRIFQAVANAVDYAYNQGMTHRDLKPDNVILTTKNEVVLTDFGIAKIIGGTQFTATGAVMGTPAYMSPEQGQGEPGDHRSDIYSLGIMLYEMVTGRVPFEADTPLAVIFKHISDPLPLPRQLNPDIPKNVEKVILKALAKDADARFQRATAMARALEDAINAETTRFEQVSPPKTITVDEAMISEEKRKPSWLWIGIAAVALVVATGAIIYVNLNNNDRLGSSSTAVGVATREAIQVTMTKPPEEPTHTPSSTPTSTLIPPTDTLPSLKATQPLIASTPSTTTLQATEAAIARQTETAIKAAQATQTTQARQATKTAPSSVGTQPESSPPLKLVNPPDAETFTGSFVTITLEWSARPLQDNEYYVLIIKHNAGTDYTWLKELSYEVSKHKSWLVDYGPRLSWQVVIAIPKQTDPNAVNENPAGSETSQYSEVRTVYWQRDTGSPIPKP